MNLRQMFPKKHFDPIDLRDFAGDEVVPVTIDRVDYKTANSSEVGEAKVDWYLFVHELKKPIKISPRSGWELGEILGSEESNDWVGRVVGIRAVHYEAYGSWRWGVNFYAVGDRQPTLPTRTDLSGYAAWNAADRARLGRALPPGTGRSPTSGGGGGKDAPPTPMGSETAARLIVRLRERGLSWSNLEAYCKSQGRPELISGMMPADCPDELLKLGKVFYSTTPVVEACPDIDKAVAELVAGWEPEPAAAKAEVIDKTTGEVINTDDIPF